MLGTDARIFVPSTGGGGTGVDEVAIQSVYPSLAGLELWVDPNASAGDTTLSHSQLSGLKVGDDHTQYHNNARGDARYLKLGGGTVTGPLVVQPPTLASHAARLADVTNVSNRSVLGGNGLSGGGALTSDQTLNVGAGTGIKVAADSVAVDTDPATSPFVLKSMFKVSTAAPSGTATTGTVWVQY